MMRNTLLLRPDSIEDDVWRWLRLGEADASPGEVAAGPLAEAAGAAAGLRVTVLVPGEQCLLSRAQVPGQSRQKVLRALPYAMEEHLSDEVENLHFAAGKTQVDGAWPVVVVSRHYMQALMAAIAGSGLDVQQVVSELQAVPVAADRITVIVDGEVALVRSGPYNGFAADTDNLGFLLAAEPRDEETPLPALHLLLSEHSALPQTDVYAAETQVQRFAGDPLLLLAQGLDASAINLLQGEFGRSGEWARIWRPWRATAALLLAGVLVSNVAMGIDYFRLRGENERLRTEIEQTFRQALPNINRIVNPRVQLQQQLDQLQRRQGAGGGFLELLAKSGSVFRQMSGIELQGVNFRGGRLDVDLTVSNLQLLDELKRNLTQAGGLSVDIQSATSSADQRVQSRLRIQGVGT